MAIIVQPLQETELDAVDAVLKAAYNVSQSRKASLRLSLDVQPDGAYVAKEDETIVGFGAVLDYGPFAYIGLMAVYPTMQKRGVGRLLLERLLARTAQRGCPTVLLDASPAGTPLYQKCDFIETDKTLVMHRSRETIVPKSASYSHITTSEFHDVAALVAFDAPLFGAERHAVLASYTHAYPGRVFVAQSDDGYMSGYLIAQKGVLGPWVARTVEDAEQLLVAALTLSFESGPSVVVSAHHIHAIKLLERYGFVWQRELRHMYRGEPVQRGRETVLFGQASLGLG